MPLRRSPKFEFEGQDDLPDRGDRQPPMLEPPSTGIDTGEIKEKPGGADSSTNNAPGQFGPEGRGGETPRDRAEVMRQGGFIAPSMFGGGGSDVAPRRPSNPEAAMGSVVDAPSGGSQAGPQGLLPFAPMDSGPAPADMATPRLRSLYGAAGGLKQGGLGIPGMANPATNDNISQLIAQLLQNYGG